MRNFYRIIALSISICYSSLMFGQNTQEKPKSMEEMAAEQADRLQKILNLEPHQVFYVDSIYQHDMVAMMAELEGMQKSGMQDVSSFEVVQTKWLNKMEGSLRKVLTDEQWIKYAKYSGKEKRDKQEEKRLLKEEKIRQKLESKKKK